MRKNNLKSIPTSEVKSRVKMWRSGKNWVYGLLFFFGMTGVSIGQAHLVHADTKTLSANTEKGTIASQLSDQKVTLQSSIKASATDRTNLVTSDSEVSDSTAQPADTGENIAESQTDADASDTTQTADDTPTDSTSGSDQTAQTGETSESETTESSTNDPATLTTTETTLSTDATSTADSSKAATTVSNAPTQGHTTQTTNTTAQQSATTNTTVDSVASSTETVPSVNTPATTDGTTSQPKTTAGDTPSTVDTTNTPFPQVGYKSMLSAAQVQALNADNDVTGGTTESTDPAVVDSTTDPADTSSNAALPDGFTVTDPDYPQGAFANSQDSGLYSFFEASTANGQVVLSVDRDTATEVYVQTISGGKVSDPVKLESGQTYQTTNNYTVIDSGNTVDSIFVMGSDFTITYDIYSYIDGAKGTWGGWAALKPFKQTQTTRYVDQNGNEIAASVKMTGLSRQRYTTGTPESLAGYKKSDSGNTAGMMSPFMEDGQTFDEELYKKDSGASSKIIDRGTLTYTVKDVDKGTVTVAFKSKDGESMPTKDLTYPLIDKATNKYVEGAFTSVGTYTVPNIYIPQTTSITYKYEASMVKVPVKFVDQNGAEITPSNPDGCIRDATVQR
jgi:hypothetical protein